MDVFEDAAKTLDFLGEDRRATRWRKVLRKLLENKGAVFGLIMVLGVIFSAVLAPLISPHDPILQDVEKRRPLAPLSYFKTHPYVPDRVRTVKEELGKGMNFDDCINRQDLPQPSR